MSERGPCASATSIEGEQPWGTLPGWTCRWKRPAICVIDEAGRIVREGRVGSEPETLVAFFRASGMAMERVGLEACSLTAWLQQGLSARGIPAICIEARQAKAAMSAMPNKTDRNDARGIAQIMRTGWFRAVHVKSPLCRSWRALLAARRALLNKRRDVENGIRALLREAGLKVGTPSRKNFAARVRELVAGDQVLMALAESLLIGYRGDGSGSRETDQARA
jgi:transposase